MAGDPATFESVDSINSSQFHWCGGQYSWADFETALAMLTNGSDESKELLAQRYLDPWEPANWQVFNEDAVTLLNAVASWQASVVCSFLLTCAPDSSMAAAAGPVARPTQAVPPLRPL